MKGYMGKIISINLTNKATEEIPLDENLAKHYIGGRGLGARLMLDNVAPNIDPLSPGNSIFCMLGPFTGTKPMIPVCQRYEFVSKSPLTGIYLCTNTGGRFGVELKRSGFDGLIITGASETPVYLAIQDDQIRFEDASQLWGLKVSETRKKLEEKENFPGAVMIGPAGEKLVKISSVFDVVGHNHRAAGRGGLGAVFGSKNLKAMIANGSKSPEVHDEDALKALIKDVTRETKENPAAQNFHRLGTVQLIASMSENGVYTGKNGQIAQMGLIGKFDAETWVANYVTRNTGCYGCTLICGKLSEVKEGKHKGKIADGPEYESFWSLGTNCGMNEFNGTLMANILCDEYGMDTISAGVTAGFALECYEKGYLDQWKAELPELKWGDEEAILKLIEMMANREGFGNVLAEGTRACAEKVGHNAMNFALQVKGLEFPAYDPRAVWGMALGYATSPRGACHLKAWTIGAEVLTGEYDRYSTDGKAGLVIGLQHFRSILDSCIVCVIGSRAVPEDMIIALLKAITGTESWNLGEIGERIVNAERYIATQLGVSRKDDTMPYRILEEPLPNGPAAGKVMGTENFNTMLSEYYDLREWDQNGIPKQETLRRLQIID